MAKKIFSTVGIDFDSFGMRAARVTTIRKGREIQHMVEDLQEIAGDFNKDDSLVSGLIALREKIGIKARTRIVTAVSGKQVFVTQIKFRELPEEEMKNALKFEIRKLLPFDGTGAALDYQIIKRADPDGSGKSTVMVTAVSGVLLERLLRLFEKAELKPWVVDVLPMVVANAFWSRRDLDNLDIAHVMIHFSPDVCNLVIDGVNPPLYSRSIYFSVEELYGSTGQSITERERAKRLDMLGDELRRSLNYYDKTYGVSNFGLLYLTGQHSWNEELRLRIREKLGLSMDDNPLTSRLDGEIKAVPGKFDAALALAIRGYEGI